MLNKGGHRSQVHQVSGLCLTFEVDGFAPVILVILAGPNIVIPVGEPIENVPQPICKIIVHFPTRFLWNFLRNFVGQGFNGPYSPTM